MVGGPARATRSTRRRAGAARHGRRAGSGRTRRRARATCWNAYSVSSATDERRSRRTNSLRSSACRRSLERAVPGATARRRPEPEHLAEHRGVLEQRLVLRVEAVQPGGDDPLHGLGQREVVLAALAQHPDELLRVERVAAGAREQRRLRLAGRTRAVEQGADQARRSRARTAATARRSARCACRRPSRAAARAARGARCRRRAAARPWPSRRGGRRSRAGRRRPSAGPRTRARPGRCSASASRKRRQAASSPPVAPAAARARRAAADAPRPARLARRRRRRRDRRARASPRHLGRVALEDPRLRLDHLPERPVA